MCPPCTFTQYSAAPYTFLMIRIRQRVRLPALKHLKLQIAFGSPPNRAAWYSCRMFNFSWTFARLRVAFLTAYRLSHTLDILFCSDSLRSSATGLHLLEFALSILRRRSLTEMTVHFLLENSLKITFCTPTLFLTNKFNWTFFFVRELHVYQQTWLYDDVIHSTGVVFPVELCCFRLFDTTHTNLSRFCSKST